MNNIINTPYKIHNATINNRVVFQPMEGCDGTTDGAISELTRRRYMRFAESGAGIIWFEAVAVTNEGRANPRQLFLNENTKESFKQLLADMRKVSMEKFGFAPVIICQSTHSGRHSKPNGTPEPIIAYRNPEWEKGKEDYPYTIATDEYCDTIAPKYATAAKLATEVGFDGVDVKCCHGYFFDELLSAYNREGRYGGSFENRTRLYFDCVDAVKANISDKMFVTTRLNCADCFPYGYGYGVNENNELDLTEAKKIITILTQKGIDLVNITIGNPYVIPHINRPCLNSPEKGEVGLKRLYDATKELQDTFKDVAIIMSGLSYPSEKCIDYAEKMLEENVATFVGFGRMTFCYPSFYQDYLKNGELDKSKCCLKCSKCTELMRHGSVTGCPIRDTEVYMPLYKKYVLGV